MNFLPTLTSCNFIKWKKNNCEEMNCNLRLKKCTRANLWRVKICEQAKGTRVYLWYGRSYGNLSLCLFTIVSQFLSILFLSHRHSIYLYLSIHEWIWLSIYLFRCLSMHVSCSSVYGACLLCQLIGIPISYILLRLIKGVEWGGVNIPPETQPPSPPESL